MKARYVRISTGRQKTDRQVVKQCLEEKLFTDVVSGSIPFAKRVQGKQLLEEINKKLIDTVVVHSIDRLGRSLMDILQTLDFFEEKGVTLKVDNLGLASRVNGKVNTVFKLIISVLGNIVEMERETLRVRQREGIAIARAKGVYKGRERGTVMSNEQVLTKYKSVVKCLHKGQSIRSTAVLTKTSQTTVLKVKKMLTMTVM